MKMPWVLTDPTIDPAEVYVFVRNPNRMSSPLPAHETTAMGTAIDGHPRVMRSLAKPVEWAFGGAIRTQTQHDALLAWAAKDHRVQLSDHFGRIFDVLLIRFNPTELRPTLLIPWRFTYEMNALVYGQVT